MTNLFKIYGAFHESCLSHADVDGGVATRLSQSFGLQLRTAVMSSVTVVADIRSEVFYVVK